ncbi:hypothetical protein BASA62_010181 [Batrachochytrium salamandrivorans]|nr:hypothetical protein BASA62_010181 [Batrachochytrium salamandrivorans]
MIHPVPIATRAMSIQSTSVPHVGLQSSVSESDYHRLADQCVHSLQDVLEELGDSIELKGFDVVYSSGVLSLKLGHLGTFVINKQPPTKQIWLSSPVSGPKRYDYDSETGKWIYFRDGHSIDELMNRELSDLLKQSVDWSPPLKK